MKKTIFLFLAAICAISCSITAQVKISQLPEYLTDPIVGGVKPAFIPVVIDGTTQKFNLQHIVIPTNVSQLNNDADYATVSQLPVQVNSDWNATSGVSQILNLPTIPFLINTGDAGRNVGIGKYSFANYPSNIGTDNTALGYMALRVADNGSMWNVAIGSNALTNNNTGYKNVAIGANALGNIFSGHDNIGIGNENTTYSTPTGSDSNEVIIGSGLIGAGSNTVSLGSSTNTDNYLNGAIHTVSPSGFAFEATPTHIRFSAPDRSGGWVNDLLWLGQGGELSIGKNAGGNTYRFLMDSLGNIQTLGTDNYQVDVSGSFTGSSKINRDYADSRYEQKSNISSGMQTGYAKFIDGITVVDSVAAYFTYSKIDTIVFCTARIQSHYGYNSSHGYSLDMSLPFLVNSVSGGMLQGTGSVIGMTGSGIFPLRYDVNNTSSHILASIEPPTNPGGYLEIDLSFSYKTN